MSNNSQSVSEGQQHSLSQAESPVMDIEKEGEHVASSTRQLAVSQENPNTTGLVVKGNAVTDPEKISDDPTQKDHNIKPEESKKDSQDQPLPTADKKPYVDYDPSMIDRQNELIRAEIEKDSPLISDVLPIEMLEFEFKGHEGFLKKLPVILKLRRDGSCFYRSFVFRLFEHLIKDKDQVLLDKMIKFVQDSKNYLELAGFEVFVIEDFMDALLNNLELVKKDIMTEDLLIETFRDKMSSDSIVMYMRFLTSGYLKTNSVLYEAFVEGGQTMDHFCQTEVEPIDKECDQLQITALINFINVPIRIVYLDGNMKKEECDVILIPEDADPKKVFITLLYRPGHYDILYPGK